MPLRLDNARALPTCPQQEQQKNQPVEPRFKIDHAASPMPETRQPERLAPRATSNRNGGRDHLGILGEIKSVHPGEIIGISSYRPEMVEPDSYQVHPRGGSARCRHPIGSRLRCGATSPSRLLHRWPPGRRGSTITCDGMIDASPGGLCETVRAAGASD